MRRMTAKEELVHIRSIDPDFCDSYKHPVQYRMSAFTRLIMRDLAAKEGISISEFTRRAVSRYIDDLVL